jgi:hyperosmotically inducible protein
MRALKILTATGIALTLCLAAESKTAQAGKQPRADENLARVVHHQLLTLPYYSVFDNLMFTIDGDKVTLSGQVVRPTLKEHAEAAVRSIEGVSSVVSTIEVLPKSPADDQLRRQVYRAIFEDMVLERYAVQAVPPIHIIVKNGAVTLQGTVDNEGDGSLAAQRANTVAGIQNLANHLVVRGKQTAAK